MNPPVSRQHEPFTAGFTGELSTWVSSAGLRYVFAKPLPRIRKDQRYMMVLDGKTIRILPLIM